MNTGTKCSTGLSGPWFGVNLDTGNFHSDDLYAELEKAAADSLGAAEKRKADLADLEVTILANSGSEGKLFGSIGPGEVAEAVVQAGKTLEKKEIRP